MVRNDGKVLTVQKQNTGMLESEQKQKNAGKSQQVWQYLWRENRANISSLDDPLSELCQNSPDSLRWEHSISILSIKYISF